MITLPLSGGFRRVVFMLAVSLAAAAVRADILELVNGDSYRGVILSMNRTNVEFQSEIQGRVLLPREKVARITFREPMVKKPVAETGQSVVPPLIIRGTNVAHAVPSSAVVGQMRQQGVDPKIVEQVQEQVFGKGSPEAAQKFNELMGGLTSGTLNIQDIRAQAQTAIATIRETKKELGPEAGDMLDGYLSILEKFVRESATDTNNPFAPATGGK